MAESEKPAIKNSTAPEVSVEHSGADPLAGHRDDIFFAAIETTRMPMLVTDPRQADNPIVFSNRAFLSMTGYEPEEIIGKNCRLLQGPDTDRATVAAIREAIHDRRSVNTELLNYRKDGTSFWNALYVSPIYNQIGELVYFFASQLDVSRRRDAEAALGQAQKMEALGQLTGGISHDFNNLLQVMSGHLDILELRARKGKTDPEAVAVSVSRIRSAVDKASTLTQQLLAFSRKQRLQGRVVNLNTVAEGLVALVQITLGEGIKVETDLQPDLLNCQLDPSQLEAAILNVLVNARDAMPTGGTVSIRTAGVEVSADDVSAFAGLPTGRYVAISITDTGTGIPNDIITRVMDPFFTTKGEGQGTGLGLSMVYGFAKQSGGTASIYSELGIGTTVRLYFPAVDGSVATPRSQTSSFERSGDERVLVVDDRPEVAELARDMLDGLGYEVSVVDGPRAALTAVEALPPERWPHLLFSDIIMPGDMNGFDLAREMQRRIPGIKVLLTTGFAGSSDANQRDGAEAYDIIKKPYRLADLARRVRLALDGSTASVTTARLQSQAVDAD